MRKFLWMQITKDKYELPIAVADSAGQLAQITGENKSNIKTQAMRAMQGSSTSFIRIELEENE